MRKRLSWSPPFDDHLFEGTNYLVAALSTAQHGAAISANVQLKAGHWRTNMIQGLLQKYVIKMDTINKAYQQGWKKIKILKNYFFLI